MSEHRYVNRVDQSIFLKLEADKLGLQDTQSDTQSDTQPVLEQRQPVHATSAPAETVFGVKPPAAELYQSRTELAEPELAEPELAEPELAEPEPTEPIQELAVAQSQETRENPNLESQLADSIAVDNTPTDSTPAPGLAVDNPILSILVDSFHSELLRRKKFEAQVVAAFKHLGLNTNKMFSE